MLKKLFLLKKFIFLWNFENKNMLLSQTGSPLEDGPSCELLFKGSEAKAVYNAATTVTVHMSSAASATESETAV